VFENHEFELIRNEFKEIQNSRNKKLRKIWGGILGLVIIIILILIVLFPQQFESGKAAWMLPTYGGAAFIVALIGFLVTFSYTSEKPFFEFIFPKVIRKITESEGLHFNYEAYPNIGKEFNVNGGLFTRFASIKTRRKLEGLTKNQHKFSVYDCTMTTSSGRSQQTHFDGNYFIIKKKLNTSIQIRTNGSPKLKGVKFKKQEGYSDLKVYKEEGQVINNVDRLLIDFMKKGRQKEEYKRVYLSVIQDEIHFAIWYKKSPSRKNKNFSLSVLNNYVTYFISEYDLCNQIDNIDSLDNY